MAKKIDTDKKLHVAIVEQMLTLATSGFGLVAALAWNEVIKEVMESYIKPYVSKGSGLISLLIYALVVTVLAVTVTLQLTRLEQSLSKKSTSKPKIKSSK